MFKILYHWNRNIIPFSENMSDSGSISSKPTTCSSTKSSKSISVSDLELLPTAKKSNCY